MFAFLGKLFGLGRSPTARHAPFPPARGFYSATAPVWRTDGSPGVFRGLSGEAIAILANEHQAQTLQDTLNLANGDRPSRRLLDAIYRDEFSRATRDAAE